ncbi:hypothetical protein LTR37_021224 [Vermiconidia calcicola]|uniref:Uncharacterized protein n=1 Tax=Vermiconidia calcicola TaxID=1690605 RepID=A0ACC3MAH4_9PEZI|nr:hypothetical protein LTR37_021224 [Vermiconidia calcicola]
MVRARNAKALAVFMLSAAGAVAQSTSDSSPITRAATTDSPSATTSEVKDVPLSLWTLAESLIDEAYPSTTVQGIRTLSWPTTIVLGSTTYTVQPGETTSTPSTLSTSTRKAEPTDTSSEAAHEGAKSQSNSEGDKRLAIILGVVLGLIAFAIMGVLFFCLWRRRKDSGSFFMRRSTPSQRSTRSWMPNGPNPHNLGNTAYAAGPMTERDNMYRRMSDVPKRKTPPSSARAALLRQQSSRSTSDDNPFYTPEERASMPSDHHELDAQQIEQNDFGYGWAERRRSSDSIQRSRPTTPFMPAMMMQTSDPATRPQQAHHNPFTSPEDREADDVVSPILPTRSPERRHSPMVHYPSFDEVSDFNFSGQDSRDGQRYSTGGGDGWRPGRERRDGRYELA